MARAREQLVEHDAQTENVAAAIDPMPFASGLFGTHVGGGAGEFVVALAKVFVSQSEPEIGDVGLAVAVDQDVARLNVSMDQSLVVGVVQCLGDGGDQFRRFGSDNRFCLVRAQVGALDELRDDVAQAVLGPADIMTGTIFGWSRLATMRASVR